MAPRAWRLPMAGHTYATHSLGAQGERLWVSRSDFEVVTKSVKAQCKEAAEVLIQELDRRFPHSDIMEAMGVVFPQYWLNPKCDDMFPVHMQVIHKWYCEVREVVVPTEEHAVAAKELVPGQLKGHKQGPNSASGARGSGNLPAEQRGKKGEAGTVGHGSGSNSDAASAHRQVA
jgi:hypothetical protein